MNNLEDYLPYVSSIWPHLLETIIVRGEGIYIWDKTGRRYLDFTSGIGVTNTGHCHPQVLAAIQVLQEEKSVENSYCLGEKLMDRLNSLKESNQCIGDVRGLGLMVGVEFVVPGGCSPDGKKAKAIQKSCLDDGLLLLTCGTDENVIRWIPPLIINENHLEEALNIFEHALKVTANS